MALKKPLGKSKTTAPKVVEPENLAPSFDADAFLQAAINAGDTIRASASTPRKRGNCPEPGTYEVQLEGISKFTRTDRKTQQQYGCMNPVWLLEEEASDGSIQTRKFFGDNPASLRPGNPKDAEFFGRFLRDMHGGVVDPDATEVELIEALDSLVGSYYTVKVSPAKSEGYTNVYIQSRNEEVSE